MPRDERDEYRGDVWYEEWRRGLPEGSLSDERIDNGFYGGVSAEALVQQEQTRQLNERLERQRAAEYEDWCHMQQAEEEGNEWHLLESTYTPTDSPKLD